MNRLVNGKLIAMTPEEEKAFMDMKPAEPEQIFGGGYRLD